MQSTSTSPPLEYGSDEEQYDNQTGTFKMKRKRSSRACDQCRKTKSKCERPPESGSCRNCQISNQECTYLGPSRKRGPPKGYITTLETRVHRLEALWGVLIASHDPRVKTLLEDLVQDGLAQDILREVDKGAFGPTGRSRILQPHRDAELRPGPTSSHGFTSSRVRREQYALGNEEDPSVPSYRWQDALINHIISRGIARQNGQPISGVAESISAPYAFSLDDTEGQAESAQGMRLPPVKRASHTPGAYPSPVGPPQDAEMLWRALYDPDMPSSEEESEYESDDPADAVGQLSLNEGEEFGFHGKTSGMHLLAKPHRSDSLNAGGIWRLPQSRFWPKSMRNHPMIEEELNFQIQLPPKEQQKHLLDLYWTHVQPVLPVLDKSKFLEEYSAETESQYPTDYQAATPHRIPRLLLLSMFTIAARYATQPRHVDGNMWEAGCNYLDEAKAILNWTYDSPRPSTCQALILLAYREFGIGAISQAWIYMGMAVRMATDLGMHRAADQWRRSGRILFSEAEKSCRKRLWYGCVILDRIMAFSMGRPMLIRERDYDTNLPQIDEREELEMWTPMPPLPNVSRPVRTLSTLNATATLSSILALVVDTIYACRSGVSFVVRHTESFKIALLLEDWYNKMPSHLKYDQDVDHVVPLPHVLTLHMMYWCTVLLVHRPFIRHHKHALAHTTVPEHEISAMSARSLARSTDAASRVTNLVHAYCETWDMTRANAFVSWYVFSAGVMHVAALTMGVGNRAEAHLGLQRCLEAFDKMKLVWPSSARAWQLLRGAEIDLSTVPKFEPDTSGAENLAHDYYEPVPRSAPSAPYPQPTYAPHPTPVSGAFPSLTAALGQNVQGPAPNLSYFPGYNHWPPESLVFEPPFVHDGDGQAQDGGKISPTDLYQASGLAAPVDMSGLHMGHGAGGMDPNDPPRVWHW